MREVLKKKIIAIIKKIFRTHSQVIFYTFKYSG